MEDPLVFDASDEAAFGESSHEFSLALNFGNGQERIVRSPPSFPHDSRNMPSPPKATGELSLSTPAISNGLYPDDESFNSIFHQTDHFPTQASSYEYDFQLPEEGTTNLLKRRIENEVR